MDAAAENRHHPFHRALQRNPWQGSTKPLDKGRLGSQAGPGGPRPSVFAGVIIAQFLNQGCGSTNHQSVCSGAWFGWSCSAWVVVGQWSWHNLTPARTLRRDQQSFRPCASQEYLADRQLDPQADGLPGRGPPPQIPPFHLPFPRSSRGCRRAAISCVSPRPVLRLLPEPPPKRLRG